MRNLAILVLTFLFLGVANAQNYSSAKPQKGEGVYAFLNRHHLSPAKYKDAFYELNKGKFGKNNSLLEHHTYLLPSSNTEIYEPLYGIDRDRFKSESDDMSGSVFYLVSGHGGPDPGAMGIYGGKKLYEDEYAYDITLRLAKKLQENGAKVHMVIQDANDGIRDDAVLKYDNDETCMKKTIPLDQRSRLRQRANMVNQLSRKDAENYKRCIVIHVDSRNKGKQVDVFFYHHAKSSKGKQLATTMRNTMEKKYHEVNPNRGYAGSVEPRKLHMITQTDPVTVFIELGNIQNYRDQKRVVIADNRQALANWMYEGIKADYLNK